ncbi:MAG: Gfo/Idh/MocA family protein [Pirellula sp.]|jgi:predicted dehydrogenase|nr:Gfo/Idh/MocA family oxidoreductase [Pirellula sp.]
MPTPSNNRRDFLSVSVSAAVATGMAQGGFFSSAGGSEKKKLGVALVGLGSLSTNQIAPALQTSQHCRLAAVVTGTPAKEKQWADKYGISTDHIYNYERFDKIASDETVDIVYVVLPNSMHPEFTIRAARAGKHVLCEKPMANTAQECRQMIDACKQANRQLAIGYRCQFEPSHLKMMELARSNEIGTIKRIDAGVGFKIGEPAQWRLRQKLAGGGALMDVGIYALQACRYLTGEEPVSIIAQESKTDAVKFAEVDESIAWMMSFASGTTAYCTTSYNLNGLNQLTATGSDGFLRLDPAFGYTDANLENSRGKIELPKIDQFATEMDDFATCILENKPSKVSGQEGLKDLLAIEAIYKSINSRAVVEVERV